jgi:mannose/fructose-specific phosphotransferase system component IIA
MSAGIVIVTHGDTGAVLLEVAEFILGESLAEIGFVPFRQSGDQRTTIAEVARHGAGGFRGRRAGAHRPDRPVREQRRRRAGGALGMVTGLNLAMLMSVWNYREKPLGCWRARPSRAAGAA